MCHSSSNPLLQADLVRLLGAHSPIQVTYAGGVRGWEDIACVQALGGGRVDVSVGSALDIFGGSLPYAELARRQRDGGGELLV